MVPLREKPVNLRSLLASDSKNAATENADSSECGLDGVGVVLDDEMNWKCSTGLRRIVSVVWTWIDSCVQVL